MDSSRLPLASRSRSRWISSTALLAITVLVAGCGSRLSTSEIKSAGQGNGSAVLSQTGSGTGTSSDGSSTGGGTTTTDGGASTGGTTGSTAVGTTGSTAAGTTGSTTATTTGGTASSSTTGSTAAGTTGSTASGTTGGTASASSANTGKDAPIFGGSRACSQAKGSTVNFGNVSTLSGVLGQLFSPVVPALQTFVKAQNACGGLNGHVIKLFVQDDQDDPSTAVSACQDMVQNNKIIAFLGNIQVLTIDGMKSCIDKTGIPIVGGDLTNNTWFSDPLLFPQGAPPQAISYGYLDAMTKRYGKKTVSDFYCLEVPQACSQIDKAFNELAPGFGVKVVPSKQISITAPSYTSQCLDAQKAKVEALALTVDAPTQNRVADSCAKVGFKPQYIAYPLGVGNEGQFLGNANLANTYVPLNTFAWMAKSTPAEKYWQASVAKYNPGFTTGDAASLGWTSGALLVAGARDFTDGAADTKTLIGGLLKLKGDNLGGLTAPLTFKAGGKPKIPYCLFAAISNSTNSGWATPVSIPVCTSTRAKSDPNQ